MRARPLLVLALAAALALLCACRRPRDEAKVVADRAVADARPKDVVDAPPERPEQLARIARQGKVVDLHAAAVTRELSKAMPVWESNDATTAWLLGKDEVLRAFDLGTGVEKWSLKPGVLLRRGVRAAGSLYFSSAKLVIAVDESNGAMRTWSFGEDVHQVLPLASAVLVQLGADDLEWIDPKTGLTTRKAKLPFSVYGWNNQLVAGPKADAYCAIGEPKTLEVACFEPTGATRYHQKYALGKPGDPPGVSFQVRTVGPRYVIFGTLFFGSGVRRAVVVRIEDGAELARVEAEVAAVVERADGTVEGLLAVQPDVALLETTGKVRWNAGKLAMGDEGASAIARDGRVYAAIFPPISSGSQLFAFDAKTGAVAWKGDVMSLAIGHSEYFNDVVVSAFEDELVLRSDEAAIAGLQLFRRSDGNRLLAEVRYN